MELDPCSKMKLLAGIIGNFLKHEAELSASAEKGETGDDNPVNNHVKNYRKEDEKKGNEQDNKSQCSAKWLTGLAWPKGTLNCPLYATGWNHGQVSSWQA